MSFPFPTVQDSWICFLEKNSCIRHWCIYKINSRHTNLRFKDFHASMRIWKRINKEICLVKTGTLFTAKKKASLPVTSQKPYQKILLLGHKLLSVPEVEKKVKISMNKTSESKQLSRATLQPFLAQKTHEALIIAPLWPAECWSFPSSWLITQFCMEGIIWTSFSFHRQLW